MLNQEDKHKNQVTICVSTEKYIFILSQWIRLFNAFGIVIRFLHIQSSLVKNISIEQMRCLLRPNTGIDIELCIACRKLGLSLLEKHLEEFLIAGLSLENWISVCKYASSYSAANVLNGCYTYLKRFVLSKWELMIVEKELF